MVLFRDEWALQHAEEKHPKLKFVSAAPTKKEGILVAAVG